MSLFSSVSQNINTNNLDQASFNNTLNLKNELDAFAIETLRDDFERLGNSGQDIDLDFAQVTFIDSSGIGALVFLFKRLRTTKCSLRLHGVQGQPLELIQYLRIDKSIQVNG
jgi:anti-anti-sigma factor